MATFFIENYGCQMNVAEKDSLRVYLSKKGHLEASSPELADVIIINTCSVRKTAETRIEGRLGFYKGLKESSKKDIKVVLMGCMAQSAGIDMKKKFPEIVRVVWGTYNKEGILNYLNSLENEKDFLEFGEYKFLEAQPESKFPFKSFVPISHGCNNYCSYCIVPYVRGKEICRKSKEIMENIIYLVNNGVKEVTLLGQNVNSYRDENIEFPELLDSIANKTGIERLTFLTSHPKDFSIRLVEVIKQNPNIMRTIHLPLQSGSNRILKLMNRKYTIEEYLEKIEWIKSIPGITISTDIIVGFPSESDKDFEDTLKAINLIQFYEAFMYYYNPRPGTAAEKFPGQIPLKIKKERLAELIRIQNEIGFKKKAEFVGSKTSILIESISKKNKREFTGRTHNGIMTFVSGKRDLIGKIINVELISISGSGMKGIIV